MSRVQQQKAILSLVFILLNVANVEVAEAGATSDNNGLDVRNRLYQTGTADTTTADSDTYRYASFPFRGALQDSPTMPTPHPSSGEPNEKNTAGGLHLAATVGLGLTLNKVGIQITQPVPENSDPVEPTTTKPKMTASVAPVAVQFRLHYGRFFGGIGLEMATNLAYGTWAEGLFEDGERVSEEDGSSVFREVKFNRLLYLGAGLGFSKKASLGIGPRIWLRSGFCNVPHMVDLTMHGAYALGLVDTSKFRLVLDFDVYGGALTPIKPTMYARGSPVFGLTASLGVSL